MNKLIITIIAIFLIIAAGIGAYFVLKKPAVPETKGDMPYYFIAIHNEPYHSEPESRKKIEQSYAILKEMVKKADEYHIKLTLMFTPQWADYISESPERMADLESWKKHGHEIAAHHHSIYHGNWDGYTDYTKEEAFAQRIKQGKTPEEYLGTFNDYINKLKKINPDIHSGCVNEEHDKAEMPEKIIYGTCSGFANYGEPGKRQSDTPNPDKGKNEFITVGNYKGIQREWLTHYQANTKEREPKAEETFNSMSSGVYGAVFHSGEGEKPYFETFLTFLHSKDPEGRKSKTVSEIIEEKLIPKKTIPEELVNAEYPSLSSAAGKNGKCGDGICDEPEKANPNLCPTDCKDGELPEEPIEQPVTPIQYSGSPFGFHPGDANDYSYIQDLGAEWSRQGQYLIWDWMDADRNRGYKFTDVAPSPKTGPSSPAGKIDYDAQWLKVPENIRIVANICPFRKGGDFTNSEESETYQNFVEKTVERYDGDNDYGCVLPAPDCYKKGDNQYPASEVIEAFKNNPIKYWQVCNQLDDVCGEDCKNNYASSFAITQERTYKGVKAADSSSYVLIAGDSNKNLYPEVFKKLNGKYIDIIDLHRFGKYDWYNPDKDFDSLKTSLQSSGFDTSKLKFWITETGTYSGEPYSERGPGLPYQSEKQQAKGLIKAYVSALSNDIEKIFWAWNIVEGFQRDCGIFDYTGLVYDGCDCVNNTYTCGPGVGYDKGKDVKKLSYYTYKKMIEVLEGSDWNNTRTVKEKDGIYIYKFVKQGKSIWVAWNDDSAEKQITISGINSSRVKITESVPKYESGKEVTDYSISFNTETKSVNSGKVFITLGDMPVFVEEIGKI